MTVTAASLQQLLNSAHLLHSVGAWALPIIALLIFIESGLLFPFLPGDSLLFPAGFLHADLGLNLWLLAGSAAVAAFLGDQVGYLVGRTAGRKWFKPDARVLKTAYLRRTEAFFSRFGGRAIVLGRFIPIVRTYTPLAAGAGRYSYRRFLMYNAIGAVLWGSGLTLLGAALGGVKFLGDHIEIVGVAIVVVSIVPTVIGVLRERHRQIRKEPAESETESATDDEGDSLEPSVSRGHRHC